MFKKCQLEFNTKNKRAIYLCGFCNKPHEKLIKERNYHKGTFCSLSCAAAWGQANKTTGYNRSAIEKWIQEQLTSLYPNLLINYNDKTGLNGKELDIYIPAHRLAFELNGPLHYIPIYGEDKLKYHQYRDNLKLELCRASNIKLNVINISHIKHFEHNNFRKGKEVLDKITHEINTILPANLAT